MWFPLREGGIAYDVAMVLRSLCEPFLSIFRRIIPPMGGIDFSPVVALIALSLAERLVFNIIL